MSNRIERTSVVENIECKLTDEEVEASAAELAATVLERNKVANEAKEIAKEFRKTVVEHDVVINELSRRVNDRTEFRNQPCTIEIDHDQDQWRLVHDATGRVVHERRLRPNERQQTLAGVLNMSQVPY